MSNKKHTTFDRDLALFKAIVNGLSGPTAKERFGLSRERITQLANQMAERIWKYADSQGFGRPSLTNSLLAYHREAAYWQKAIEVYAIYMAQDGAVGLSAPLIELGFTNRIYNALMAQDICTVKQLVELAVRGEAAILAIPQLGESAVNQIREKLKMVDQSELSCLEN